MQVPTLLLIDIQRGFAEPFWGQRNNAAFETNVAALLSRWRSADWLIIHVRHDSTHSTSPLRPGQLGNDFMACAEPQGEEPVISKTVNSAFIGTDLMERLVRLNVKRLVIAGLCTDHCVSTTVRMGANLGFEVTVAADATATYPRHDSDGNAFEAELVHRVSLASLSGEFATVATTAEIMQRDETGLEIWS